MQCAAYTDVLSDKESQSEIDIGSQLTTMASTSSAIPITKSVNILS